MSVAAGSSRYMAERTASIAGYWNAAAPSFDQEPDHGLSADQTRAAGAHLLGSLSPSPPRDVLDTGCGTGSSSLLLAEAPGSRGWTWLRAWSSRHGPDSKPRDSAGSSWSATRESGSPTPYADGAESLPWNGGVTSDGLSVCVRPLVRELHVEPLSDNAPLWGGPVARRTVRTGRRGLTGGRGCRTAGSSGRPALAGGY